MCSCVVTQNVNKTRFALLSPRSPGTTVLKIVVPCNTNLNQYKLIINNILVCL